MADNKTMAAKCLRCGGELNFDPAEGKLKCIYCDSVFTNEEIEAALKEKEEKLAKTQNAAMGEWSEDEVNAYKCSSCGAEMIAEENTAALRCPYCGNQTIVPAQLSGAASPDFVIPFSFTKEQAMESYKGYYSTKKLLPKSFLSGNKVEEIQGVYVPFWLFSGDIAISGDYMAADTEETDTEEITKFYEVRRKGSVSFKDVPADASERMADDLMDSIEPFDYTGLKNFSMVYLPGFLAERFNVSEESNTARVEKRLKNTAKDMVRKTIKHDDIKSSKESFDITYAEKKYAMLPVWLLTTNWDGNRWTFAMNGQTGKFTGDLPIDKGKMAIRSIIAFAIPFLICWLLLNSLAVGVIASLIVAGIVAAVSYSSMKPVSNASSAAQYTDKAVALTVRTDTYKKTERKKKKQNQ